MNMAAVHRAQEQRAVVVEVRNPTSGLPTVVARGGLHSPSYRVVRYPAWGSMMVWRLSHCESRAHPPTGTMANNGGAQAVATSKQQWPEQHSRGKKTTADLLPYPCKPDGADF